MTRKFMEKSTIQPKGEKVRNAIKWISCERMEDQKRTINLFIQDAAMRFNLSPKEEDFLRAFYKEIQESA